MVSQLQLVCTCIYSFTRYESELKNKMKWTLCLNPYSLARSTSLLRGLTSLILKIRGPSSNSSFSSRLCTRLPSVGSRILFRHFILGDNLRDDTFESAIRYVSAPLFCIKSQPPIFSDRAQK